MAWGIWRLAGNDLWADDIGFHVTVFIISSWHLAVIGGSIMGSVLVRICSKRLIYVCLILVALEKFNLNRQFSN